MQEPVGDTSRHPAQGMDRPSGSAPPDAVQSTAQQEARASSRAASEPIKLDLFLAQQQQNGRDTPSTSSQLPDFDWEDFEARYERALEDADEHEREILKEAESLSKVRPQCPSCPGL